MNQFQGAFYADDCRNPHGFCHDDGVGVFLAGLGDDALDLGMIERRHIGREQFLRDQNAWIFQMEVMGFLPDEIGQDASADVFHVCGSFSQVGIVHAAETLDVFGHHFFQGIGSAVLLVANFPCQPLKKPPIFKDHQMRMKDGCVVR